jgi:hypothetical protein
MCKKSGETPDHFLFIVRDL